MRRALLIAVLACSALAFVRGPAYGDAPAQRARALGLLDKLAEVEALSARFREEKHMALLAAPLVSEGTLYYQKPRLLARHTLSPEKSSLVLDGRELAFGDAQHTEKMGVDAQPAVRVLVDTFVAVLSGDRRALEQMADVRIETTLGGGFRIAVTPKDPAVLRIVRAMSFEGEGVELKRMELLDANGDRTVTTFSDIRFRGRF